MHGAAREFAEAKGYGPRAVDSCGWTLLHHAVAQSQNRRGMFEVVRGLLEAMPVEVVNQRTFGGTPTDWSALSLVCNARDEANERAEIVQLLVNKRAELEVRNAHGATPLISACAVGVWSAVRVLLDARADAFATNNRGRNALDLTPRDQTKVV